MQRAALYMFENLEKYIHLFPWEITLKYNTMSFCHLNTAANSILKLLLTCHIQLLSHFSPVFLNISVVVLFATEIPVVLFLTSRVLIFQRLLQI
jgi:hypothetical protein